MIEGKSNANAAPRGEAVEGTDAPQAAAPQQAASACADAAAGKAPSASDAKPAACEASLSASELRDVAGRFGTPAFLFDVAQFERRFLAIREIFGDNIDLCFAIKANPFLVPAAARVARRLEVCSPGELDICETLGVDPAKIVFSGVNKTAESVRAAADFGVEVLTAESRKHMALIEAEGARRGEVLDVLLRLNAGSQFGMSRDDLIWLVGNRADFKHVRIVGLHYFVGTQRTKLKHQRKELARLLEFIDELKRDHGFDVQRLEYGPGLGVPLFEGDDFSDTLAPARELAGDLARVAERVQLTVEMGRFFATECGTYLTAVNDVKENGGVNYCIVDGGINHLTYVGQLMGMKTPVIEHIAHPIGVCAVEGVDAVEDGGAADAVEAGDVAGAATAFASRAANTVAAGAVEAGDAAEAVEAAEAAPADADAPTDATREWCICGSLCTTNDVLTRAVQLADVREGDVLAFRNAGAYAVTEGVYLFLSRTMPRVIMRLGDGSYAIARDFAETSSINTCVKMDSPS